MRILILSQNYLPEPGSAAMRMSEMAEYFASKGHKVTVITAFPNYPEGKIYKGYRGKVFLKEEIKGVKIIRTFVLTIFRKNKFISRMGCYLSFMLSSIFGGIAAGKHDLIYFYSPPIFLGISAHFLSLFYRICFAVEVNDLWPKAPIALGILKNKILIRFAESLERFVYAKAHKIFLYSNRMRQNLIDIGVPPGKTEIHYLWVHTDFFSPQDAEIIVSIREKFNISNKFIVMYAGNIGLAQGIGTVIESACLLKDKSEITFVLVGGGSERDSLVKRVNEYNLKNVIFIQQQPLNEMPGLLSSSAVLLVHLDKAPHRLGTIPAKTLAFMSCGKPILMAAEGEAANLIERSRSGIVIPPQNAEEMAKAIQTLYNDDNIRKQMGKNGREYAISNFNQKKILQEIEESFQLMIKKYSRI